MRKLKGKEMEKLEFLKKRSILIIDYILGKTPSPFVMEMRKSIYFAYEKKNIKALEIISKDMNSWMNSMSQEDIEKIERLLNDKLEYDLVDEKLIQRIALNGKIMDENEYRIIHEYLSDVSIEILSIEEIKKFNNLLLDFDEKK
jgi:hypothetical protein